MRNDLLIIACLACILLETSAEINVGTNCANFSRQAVAQVKENATKGTILYKFTGIYSLEISAGNYSDFEIKNNSGNWTISTKKSMDFETVNLYTFKVSCKDTSTSTRLIYDIRVNVNNVLEPNFTFAYGNGTTISDNMVYRSVPETQRENSMLLTLQTIDKMEKDPYDIVWDVNSINDKSPEIRLNLNREKNAEIILNETLNYNVTQHTFNYILTATVDGHPEYSKNLTLTLDVTDVDDKNPKFDRKQYIGHISENATVGTSVTIVNATIIKAKDQDLGINANINYEVIDALNLEASTFNITGYENGAQITLAKHGSLDREKFSSVTLVIRAYQKDNPNFRQDVAVVYINIIDVNDNHPVMEKPTYDVDIQENMANNQPIFRVFASDADEGINAKFEYIMEDCSPAFEIDKESGRIKVKNSTLVDIEKTPSFHCQVYAKETSTKEKHQSNKTQVNITLKDVNDNNPKFSSQSYTFNVTDNDRYLGKVSATDDDIDKATNGKISYSLSSYTDLFSMKIDPVNGTITRTGNLDCTKTFPQHVDIYVTASDNPSDSSMKRNSTIKVTLEMKTNVCPPRIIYNGTDYSNKTLNVTIQEDYTYGSNGWISFQIKDGDPLPVPICDVKNKTGTFQLQRMDDSLKLNAHLRTWIIQLTKPLDREQQSTHLLIVQANDTKHVTTLTLNIDVADVNDNAPVFCQPVYTINVTEESTDDNFLQVKASDKDIGRNGEIRYQILASQWESYFGINTSTGSISLIKKLDRERLGSLDTISLTVIAEDRGSPSMNNSCVVNIKVIDINDNVPEFCDFDQNLTFTFNEGEANKKFYAARATDKDDGGHEEVLYAFSNNTNSFKIDEKSGAISIAAKLQRHDTGKLNIVAYNKRYTYTTLKNQTLSISIEVKDINDHIPKFIKRDYNKTIEENLPIGSVIQRVEAGDDDWSEEFGSVYYWITKGNIGNLFTINQLNGTVYLDGRLDYESKQSYDLTITASDCKQLDNPTHTGTTILHITISDVNDEKPKFEKDFYQCHVKENSTGNFNCTVKATDKDVSKKFSTVTYKLKNYTSVFKISENGTITVVGTIDFDAGNHEYYVNVEATDRNNNSFSSTCLVHIIVKDVNDTPPKFNQSTYSFKVSENQPIGTVVGCLRATDIDSKYLTYGIMGNTKDFKIDSSKGIITTARVFDFEKDKHIEIHCIVNDTKQASNTSVAVKIEDMNDNDPIFNSSIYKAYIEENTSSKVILRNISASDIDENQTLTYELLNSFDGLFSIDSKSGTLSINHDTGHGLNFQRKNFYLLQLNVTDDGRPPLHGFATVEIYLIDIDNTCPVFRRSLFHVTIQENKTYDDILQHCDFQELATDVDTATNKLNYTVLNHRANFTFDGHKLKLLRKLDAETETAVNLTIGVTDNSSNNCTNTSTIQIEIENVNDNPPNVNAGECNKHVFQNFTGFLCKIKATDADDAREKFTFFLNQTYGLFIINYQNGEVTVENNNGDLEVNKTYTVTVGVSDHGSPPLISMRDFNVTVDILNHYPPVFSNPHVTVKITEKSEKSFSVYNMTANDQDGGNEGRVKYQIVHGDTSVFTINENTGEISLKTALSCDPSEYLLNVKASDQGFDPKSATGTVTVSVENVNDNPVFDNINFNICVNPPLEANFTIAKIVANDPDYRCTKNSSDKNIHYSLLNHTDYFNINREGEIYTLQNWTLPDGSIDLEVKIQDNYGASSFHTYKISPGSDRDPVIRPKVTNIDINENYTGLITKLNATGAGNITFKLVNSSIDMSFFCINYHTGELYLENPLDRESFDTTVSLIVEASNQNCNCSCPSQVIIHIKDVNDNAPYFIETPYNLSYEENKTEQCIHHISAKDKDADEKLIFTIIPGLFSEYFNLNVTSESKSCLNLVKALDAETNTKISLEIRVSDGVHNTTTNITVNILDVNDNLPQFTQKLYLFNVSEDTFSATLGNISASDKDMSDKGKLVYKVVTKDQSQPFEVNPDTGELIITRRLDRENKSAYVFNVSVHDSWENHTSTAEVHVTVLDVNDNAPTFDQLKSNYSVQEGENSTFLEISLTAKDPDAGENGNVTFTLVNSYNGQFSIENRNTNKGIIRVKHELDYEAKGIPINSDGMAVYTLNVVAADQGGPSLTSTAKIEIFVSDINDCSPEFKELNMSTKVMEGSRIGFNVYRVTATDCDFDPKYRDLTYSLQGTDNDYFNITKKVYGGQQEGWVTLAKQISVDNKTDYYVTVIVTDGPHTNQTLLRVVVVDVNDHDPVFTQAIYNFSIPENDKSTDNETANTCVGQVNATDLDFETLSYKIVTSDVEDIFNVTQDGWIYLINRVDHDNCTSHKHSFTVVAEDTGSPKRMGFTEVVVNIMDVNDNSPEFQPRTKTYFGRIRENSSNGTAVLFNPPISAKDIDDNLYGTKGIVFSLLQDDYNNSDPPFQIDNKTGQITVYNNEKLDRETATEYNMTVEAKDDEGKPGCHVTNVSISIRVEDENDNSPIFDEQSYNFSIAENATYGTFVGGVTATDRDLNPQLTYYMQSGADGHFLITDKTSGTITVGDRLDRETQSNYTINVTVTDGLHSNSVEVLIELSDINDNPPKFGDSFLKVEEVEESNLTYPVVIYTVTATDEDEGENRNILYYLNYSASDPDIGTLFNLSKDGELYLHEKLDREKKDEYNLIVYAVDGGTPRQTSSATIRISVEDINDNYPVFYNQNNHSINTSTASILEMSPINSIIYVPICLDKDEGENGTAGITYDINCQISDGKDLLHIDERSGTVYIKNQLSLNVLLHDVNNTRIQILNGSSQAVIIPCTITATDGGHKSSSLTLDLTVENINDNAPVFKKPSYVFHVPENATNDYLIDRIEAIVTNKTYFHLTYSMIDHSEVSSNISVNADGSIHTKGVLDRETKATLTFAAKVVDGRVPERTAYTVVSVTLDDVNDNSPEFNESTYKYFITEDDPLPPPFTVYAFDKDLGENADIVYTLTGNGSEKFTLNSTTGILAVNGALDREMTPFLNLQVTATDKGSPPLSSSVNITVTVLDINDNDPKFDSDPTVSQVTANVTENHLGTQSIAKVKADDDDAGLNGTVVYSIEPEESLFQIDSLSGTVFCTTPLDYEKQSVYLVTIMATDLGSPSRSAATNLTVYVIDVPDNSPNFNQSLYETSASINDKRGKSLITLHAGDHAIYSIIDGNQESRFEMSNTTGEVTVYRALSFGKPEYLLAVEARDADSNLTASTKILIHIEDFDKASSSLSHNTVKIQENINETKLVTDLKQFTHGPQMDYSIKSVTPNEYNIHKYFYISGSGLYCNHSLDREETEKITLIIQYTEKPVAKSRTKRSVPQYAEMTLVIEVTDTNDNPPCFQTPSRLPPCFSNSSEDVLVYGVPIGAKPGDLVGVIKAVDPDSSSEGRVTYNITGGDANTFYIHPASGQIFLRKTVYQDHRNNYTLSVTAADQDGNADTVEVSVLVVPIGSSMILTVPGLSDQIEANRHRLVKELGKLTGFKFEFEKSTPHTESNQIDLCRADVVCHCIDLKTNSLVSKSDVEKVIKRHTPEITELFCQFFNASPPCQQCKNVTVEKIPLQHSSKISTAEIALIAISAVMLVGVAVLIAILLGTSTSDKEDEEEEKHSAGNVDMWELESLKSSTVAKTTEAGVVNPMFLRQAEREATQTSQVDATESAPTEEVVTRKKSISEESQEVVMDFQEDDCFDECNDLGQHQMSHSNADSGVENESDSSRSESIQTENGLLESEGGPESSAAGANDLVIHRDQEDLSNREKPCIFISMDTGDTSDGEMSESSSVDGERNSNEVEDSNKEEEIRQVNKKTEECDIGDTEEFSPPVSGAKSVSFKPGPPVIEEYEAEEDAVTCL